MLQKLSNSVLVYCLLCVLVCVCFFDHLIVNMFPLDLNKDQYNLKDELDIRGCEYVEINGSPQLKKEKSDLRIIQLNIRGLMNKQDQLQRLLAITDTDAILVCETWLTKIKEKLVDITGYKLESKIRTDKLGGGVGIIINKHLRSRPRPDLEQNTEILEHVILEVKTDKRNILLVSGYRPPNTNVKKFLLEYKNLIKQLTKIKSHEVIIGIDHNLDLLKTHKHSHTNDFLEINLRKNLLPTISKPTRITTKSATLIDNVFLSTKLQTPTDSNILLEDISDHLPCMITMHKQLKCVREIKTVTTRPLTDNNLTKINTDISAIDWNQEFSSITIEESFNKFHNILCETINTHAPEQTKKISVKKAYHDPWITKGITTSLSKQKKMYIKMLKTKKDSDKIKYTTYRNKLKSIIRKSKNKYLHDKCTEYRQESRKLWQLINRLLKKENNKHHVIEGIRTIDTILYDPESITNTFCEFFSSIGEKYASQLSPMPNEMTTYLNQMDNNNKTLYLSPCTDTEIYYLIKDLPHKTSSGHDNISNVLLKKLSPSIIHPLCILFNKSMEEGKFPETMKHADVVPLYKSGDQYECTNYRPISLLLTMSKLLEKVMYKRTYNFLETTGQLYCSQYGFRTGHSCEHAVSELLAEIIKSKEEGLYTAAMFLDLSKAFDTLEHEVVLRKLEKYGVRGIANNWYRDYLSNRKMRVKCTIASTGKTEYSDYKQVTYGTPQGSCLGPLIFIIFTNDLHHQLHHCKSLLFADDTTIYKSHRNLQYLTWCIEDDMNRLMNWFKANKLTLNIQKTVCILFQKPGSNKTIQIRIENITIHNTTETKFLGIWLDENCKWNTHIQKLSLKLTRNTNLLKYNQNQMPIITKKLVYHAHISSHIQYGMLLWGNNASEEQLNKLQKIQNKCIHHILPITDTNLAFHKLGILKIKDMLTLANLKFGYKLTHNLLPSNIRTICLEDSNKQKLLPQHKYNTRTRSIPNFPKATTKLYKNSFLYKGPRSVLSVETEVQNASTLGTFIGKCKQTLLNKYVK